jgi:hypothetical protein
MSTLKVNSIVNLNSEAQFGPLLKTEQVTTSGTNFDYTAIPSWVTKITVMFNEVSLSGTDNLLVQLSTGASFVATGYVSTGVTVNNASATSGTSSTAGFVMYPGGAASVTSGLMTIARIGSGNTWISSHACKQSTTNILVGGGSITLAGACDGVRITRSGTNTFDAGSVNIMLE